MKLYDKCSTITLYIEEFSDVLVSEQLSVNSTQRRDDMENSTSQMKMNIENNSFYV